MLRTVGVLVNTSQRHFKVYVSYLSLYSYFGQGLYSTLYAVLRTLIPWQDRALTQRHRGHLWQMLGCSETPVKNVLFGINGSTMTKKYKRMPVKSLGYDALAE